MVKYIAFVDKRTAVELAKTEECGDLNLNLCKVDDIWAGNMFDAVVMLDEQKHVESILYK